MTPNIGGIGTVHQEPVMGTVVTFDVVTPASTGDVEAALRDGREMVALGGRHLQHV